jgi:outer membrane receptor protein involved in Fe transport
VDAEYVGERFADEANISRLPSYLLLNAEVRQELSDRIELTVAGKNLLNQVYQSVNGYVMPPLSFWIGAELTL